MRKVVKYFIIIMALSLFLCYSENMVFATDQTSTDYDALFDKSDEVDGIYSDKHAIILADYYDRNPDEFINALASKNIDDRASTIQLLVYEYQFRNIDRMIEHMNQLLADNSSTQSAKDLASSILILIQNIQHPIEPSPDLPNSITTDNSFNASVVRKIIDANLSIDTQDEGFCEYISSMYQKSPNLFADMISDMSSETISKLGKYIANGMNKRSIDPSSINISTTSSTLILLSESIASSIQASNATDTVVGNTSQFYNLAEPAEYLGTIPTIVSIAFDYDTTSKTDAQVGDIIDIDVTIQDTNNQFSLVVYYVELYEIIDGQYSRIDGSTLAIPPGSTQATYSFRKIFDISGCKSFYVKVYTEGKTIVLNERTFSEVLDVYGFWSILVELPTVRQNFGCLTAFDSSGAVIYKAICLGCSADNLPVSVKNGHTPPGTYRGTLVGPDANTDSYGPYKVIHMVGIDGDIVTKYSNRSDICIHGGKDGTVASGSSNYPLAKTNGCVRITSQFQGILVQMIEDWINNSLYYSNGTITIEEIDAQTIDHPTTEPWYETA